MAGATAKASGQPALDPGTIEAQGLAGVQEDWRHAMHMYQPCAGLHINCIQGRPRREWAFEAEGPAAFSINILLEGHVQTAFDQGATLNAKAGSTILMAAAQPAAGWDILDTRGGDAFRMLSIHIPQMALEGLTGLQMDDLRHRLCEATDESPGTCALLNVTPVSSNLQRVACDLLGYGCASPGDCISRNLFLRGKALEAIACYLRDNLAPRQTPLPVPADRSRLLEARLLLEQSFDQEWSVQSLARAVGLNEKRLQSGFQALFGCTVHTCLTRIRLDAAVAMLQCGTNVTETAASCGFASLSHFSRVFRSHTGISPKQCALGLSPRAHYAND